MSPQEHPPRPLHAQLAHIRLRVLEMGAVVEAMIATSTRAVIERDDELVRQVIDRDTEVDRLEIEIDEECHSALARNQPTAVDMRFLVAVMKITADLERMADSAVNIAQAARQLNAEGAAEPYVELPELAEKARTMARQSLDAFAERDVVLARRVLADDDEVDRLYKAIFSEMVERMRSEPGGVRRALHLLLVARNLERVGDHATNVAEDVVYYVEGRDIRHQGPEPA
jgi:phosphate transport system protein